MVRNVLLAGLACAFLAGCGNASSDDATTVARTVPAGPRMLDTKKVAQAITASIRAQRGATATVTCPTAIKQAKDVNFVCSAKSKFGVTDFAVVQKDAAGHVSYVAARTPK